MVSPQSLDLSRIRPQDVAVVIGFLAAIFIFRAPDVYELKPVWRLDIEKTTGSEHNNILPLPIIVDLDSDGINELVVATQDGRIRVMTFPTKDFGGDLLPHLHIKVETSIKLDNVTSDYHPIPVTMATGCLKNRARHDECYKTIIVVTSDWSVLAYDHFLNLLWKTTVKVNSKTPMHFKEIAVLAIPQGQDGLVVVGGRTTDNKHHKQKLSHDHHVDAAPKETVEELARKSNTHSTMDPNKVSGESEHFSTFAFNGREGGIVWSHKPGDFAANVTAREHLLSSYHFKLALQPNQYHTGEEHWTKYLMSFLKTLPYRWHHPSDTKLFAARFVKGSRKTMSKAAKQSWFDIKAPNIDLFSSEEKKSEKDVQHNSIVVHNQHGVEVLKLDSGRPICRYTIPKESVSLGDINEDGHVDHVTTHFESRDDFPNSVPSCTAVVSSQSRTLFTGSICRTLSLFGGVFDGPADTKHGEEPLPVPPVIIHSPPHRSGILRHLMGHNLRRSRVGFDSVFLVSTGKVTSFGPHGELNWQVKVDGSWKDRVRADELSMTQENTRSFLPSMKPVAIESNQNQKALFIASWHHISLVSLVDGTLLASHTLPCQPVSPVVEGDFTNDGLTDVVVQCSDSYLGFSLDRHIGYMWTIIWVVSSMMAVAIALGLLRVFEEELFVT
ncbi:uncharacterized protein LOC116292784 [Actinia tenebrosa]|uniref:Uncharacterized protein LOC116292784 n=1 Tax=Actinia tenebrosa TaxID=6105 RepID=A0A6P8HHZ2_ACTTE|nr:uncharacterized protein LOC116292784 [Actinia tenebrosa]